MKIREVALYGVLLILTCVTVYRAVSLLGVQSLVRFAGGNRRVSGQNMARGPSMSIHLSRTYTVTVPEELGGEWWCGRPIGASCALGPSGQLFMIGCAKAEGPVLDVCDVASGEFATHRIPRPRPPRRPDWPCDDFMDPELAVNERGDALIIWQIGGNGDHGIALLKNGGSSFAVGRCLEYALWPCKILSTPEGSWFILSEEGRQGWRDLTRHYVLRVSADGAVQQIGAAGGMGRCQVLDAAFVTEQECRVFLQRGDALGGPWELSEVGFDVGSCKWSSPRRVYRGHLPPASDAIKILPMRDGSHYVWGVKPLPYAEVEAVGIYQASDAGAELTCVASGFHGLRVLAVGESIVVCYSQEGKSGYVMLRVISGGALGPTCALRVPSAGKHPMSGGEGMSCADGRMVLGTPDGRRVWFMDTADACTVYELELAEVSGNGNAKDARAQEDSED